LGQAAQIAARFSAITSTALFGKARLPNPSMMLLNLVVRFGLVVMIRDNVYHKDNSINTGISIIAFVITYQSLLRT